MEHRCEIQHRMCKKIMVMSHKFDCRVPVDIDYGHPMFKWSAVPWRKLGYKDSIFINGHQGAILRSSRTVVLLLLRHMSFLLFQITCKSTVFSAALFREATKETSNLHNTDPLRLESTGDRWVTLIKGQWCGKRLRHCSDVIMGATAPQITSLTIVYSAVNSCRRRSNKTSKFRVTSLCAGNSPVTGEFPAQRSSNAENVSIWWRHHETSPCHAIILRRNV